MRRAESNLGAFRVPNADSDHFKAGPSFNKYEERLIGDNEGNRDSLNALALRGLCFLLLTCVLLETLIKMRRGRPASAPAPLLVRV